MVSMAGNEAPSCSLSWAEELRGVVRFIRCGAPAAVFEEVTEKDVQWRYVGPGQGRYSVVGDGKDQPMGEDPSAAEDPESMPACSATLRRASPVIRSLLPQACGEVAPGEMFCTREMFCTPRLGPQNLLSTLAAYAADSGRRLREFLGPFREAVSAVSEGRCPAFCSRGNVFMSIIYTMVILLVVGTICLIISVVSGPAGAYDSEGSHAYACTGRDLPPQEQAWCCDHRLIGCPKFDCSEGVDTAPVGWSLGKRKFCCLHEGKGCPASPDHIAKALSPKLHSARVTGGASAEHLRGSTHRSGRGDGVELQGPTRAALLSCAALLVGVASALAGAVYFARCRPCWASKEDAPTEQDAGAAATLLAAEDRRSGDLDSEKGARGQLTKLAAAPASETGSNASTAAETPRLLEVGEVETPGPFDTAVAGTGTGAAAADAGAKLPRAPCVQCTGGKVRDIQGA